MRILFLLLNDRLRSRIVIMSIVVVLVFYVSSSSFGSGRLSLMVVMILVGK